MCIVSFLCNTQLLISEVMLYGDSNFFQLLDYGDGDLYMHASN